MNLIDLALRDLGLTEADMQRGFKDVAVRLRDGTERTVRLSVIAPRLRPPVLARYIATEDARTLIRPMLAPDCARDDFLDSLTAPSLAKLANVAIGLFVGPENLRQMAAQALTAERGG